MKVTELRINNWIQFRHTETPVRITLGDFVREYNDEHLEDYEPIPLTEEWLLKFGFDSDPYQDMYVLGWLKINCDKTRGGLELWVENITGNVVYLQHVHSLQNLYFALTGEELTIKTINQNKEDDTSNNSSNTNSIPSV